MGGNPGNSRGWERGSLGMALWHIQGLDPAGKLGWLEQLEWQPRMLQRLRELSGSRESRTLDPYGSWWDRAEAAPGAGAPFPLFLLWAGGKEEEFPWIFPLISQSRGGAADTRIR